MKAFKTFAVIAIAAAALMMNAVVAKPASANVVLYNGLYYGNICQTVSGWQIVPWQLVGTSCYSPGWGMYGVIANY